MRADFRSQRADSRPARADFSRERADFRLERADFRPDRAWGGSLNAQTNGRRDKQKSPVFPLRGRCPKKRKKGNLGKI